MMYGCVKFTVYLKGNILKYIHGSSRVNKWTTDIRVQNKISSPPCNLAMLKENFPQAIY